MYSVESIVFENWKIEEEIGAGSFGTVYSLYREDFGEVYRSAMKVIHVPQDKAEIHALAGEGMTEQEISRYLYESVTELVQEFSIMAKLKATGHIVSYEDHRVIPRKDGIGWDIQIRMELLTPLLDYASQNPFTRQDIIRVGIDICKALELCQKYNIIHRDIKPDNIYVTETGDFKLGDFGIARSLERSSSGLSKKGTYNYMAPEIYTGGDYGFGVDTYSLGIVLYRLLNRNRLPFLPEPPQPITIRDRELALVKRMSGEKIPLPCYGDGRLGEIVLKACSHDPGSRYRSPMQMRQELEAILCNETDERLIYPSADESSLQKNAYASQGDNTVAPQKQPSEEDASIQDQTAAAPRTSGTVSPPKTSVQDAQEITILSSSAEQTHKKEQKRSRFLAGMLLALVLIGAAFAGILITKSAQAKLRNYESCMSQAQQFRASDPDTALALYRNAQELYPEAEEPYIAYAYTLFDARRYDACITYIETDLALGKDYSDAGQSQLSEILGAAYFELEDYAAAASFFRLSAESGTITVSAMRDYAVSLGRLGQLQTAADVMEQMIQAGASGAVMAYIQAEIDFITGNYLSAEEGFQTSLQTAADPSLQRRVLLSLAALYRTCTVLELEGYCPIQDPAEKQVRILSEGIREFRLENDAPLVEMLAMAYYEAAQVCEDAQTREDHLRRSADHFAMAGELGIRKDYLLCKLYSIHSELGDYDQAAEDLNQYEEAFPQDYTPHALRAMLLITMENEKPLAERDYSPAAHAYETAGNLIRSTDDQAYYQQLQGQIEQLKKNGWLQ